MPNRWITHIKEYAEKNNLSYNCSLCDPNMRREYYKKYPKKGVEIDPKKTELEEMFQEYQSTQRTKKSLGELAKKIRDEKKKYEGENKKNQLPPEVEYKTFTPQQIAFLNRNR